MHALTVKRGCADNWRDALRPLRRKVCRKVARLNPVYPTTPIFALAVLSTRLEYRAPGLERIARRIKKSLKRFKVFVNVLSNAIINVRGRASPKNRAVLLLHAANLILQISADADEARPGDQDRPDGLAFLALDADFQMPANANEFGKPAGVVLIALVHSRRQRGIGVPCVDTRDRQTNAPKLAPDPARHRACLKTNTLSERRSLAKQRCQGAGLRPRLALERDLARVINDAHRSLTLRHVQSDIPGGRRNVGSSRRSKNGKVELIGRIQAWKSITGPRALSSLECCAPSPRISILASGPRRAALEGLVHDRTRSLADVALKPLARTGGTSVNRVKRLHERGSYDHAQIHALLDASMLRHVPYVIDGQPYCTRTLFWREGARLYWRGSSASRMLRDQSEGEPVCLTVSHLDSLVLARCGFNHSVDYRSVMAFGRARMIEEPGQKARALIAMVDRIYPGRTTTLRESATQEIKATPVIGMEIEQASAKVRANGISDEEEDYALPIYAERTPAHTVLGAPEPCARLSPASNARKVWRDIAKAGSSTMRCRRLTGRLFRCDSVETRRR